MSKPLFATLVIVTLFSGLVFRVDVAPDPSPAPSPSGSGSDDCSLNPSQ